MIPSYDIICETVNYDRNLQPPEPVYIFYAYSNGNVYTCGSEREAKAICNNTERGVQNMAEIAKFWDEQRVKENRAHELWYNKMLTEYSYLPSLDIFNLCYGRAYERGHSDGHDEIASQMSSIVEFAEAILAAK
jgi:hypothetical protein